MCVCVCVRTRGWHLNIAHMGLNTKIEVKLPFDGQRKTTHSFVPRHAVGYDSAECDQGSIRNNIKGQKMPKE